MITLHLKQLNQFEHEVVVFGDVIVVDTQYYNSEDLENHLFSHYPLRDLWEIKETFELNQSKFPNESNDLITKLDKFSLT